MCIGFELVWQISLSLQNVLLKGANVSQGADFSCNDKTNAKCNFQEDK